MCEPRERRLAERLQQIRRRVGRPHAHAPPVPWYVVQRRDPRVVVVEHRDVVGLLTGEHPELGLGVRLQRAVPIEMVGRDVEQHADAGSQLVDVLELEARQLAHDPRALAQLTNEARDGVADVAGHRARNSSGLEHRAGQARRGRLAVRAGDPDPRVLRSEQPEGQLDLAPDGHARGASSGDDGRRARDAGALHQEICAVGERGILADQADDTDRQLVGQPVAIDQEHGCRRPRPAQRGRRGDAGASRPDDEHARSIEGAVRGHRACFAPGAPPPPVSCTG